MSARHKARKRALDVLFEADQRGLDPLDVLRVRQAAGDPPVAPYAAELVEGVVAHLAELDALVGPALAAPWTIARLPAVDRSLLRLGAWELRYGAVDVGVAISEAVDLAAELSTDQSPAYVNGVLASVARTPAGQAPEPVDLPAPSPAVLPEGAVAVD